MYMYYNFGSACDFFLLKYDKSCHNLFQVLIPYLFEYKSHSSKFASPKLGPELGTKFFHVGMKGTLEMHEDSHSDHISSSLTVVKTMLQMFTHASPCFFQHFHVFLTH